MEPDNERASRSVEHVLAVLNAHDPAGLAPGAPGGTPADEYLLEAVPLVEILFSRGVVDRNDLIRVWTDWFSDDLSWMPNDELAAIVTDLNAGERA